MKNHTSSFFHLPSSFTENAHGAFSLVELIVVMGIIAVLAGVLMASFGGGTESARAARCLSNMKNLASATQTYGMSSSYYPLAGNLAYMTMVQQKGNRVKKEYKENAGWISANSQNVYPSTSYSTPESVSMYSKDQEAARYALTNGVLWKCVSGSRETYVCPEHAKHMGSAVQVNWSYLMNAAFGWDKAKRPRANAWSGRTEYGTLSRSDKTLLFSEVPFMGFNGWQPEGSGGSTDTDAILQYSESGLDSKGSFSGGGSAEEIGVNHKNGKFYFAHVAFADGHVEKLRMPMNGKKPDTSGLAELTSWLCAGYDVSFDGSKYNRVK